jgi:hypothetical protein
MADICRPTPWVLGECSNFVLSVRVVQECGPTRARNRLLFLVHRNPSNLRQGWVQVYLFGDQPVCQ